MAKSIPGKQSVPKQFTFKYLKSSDFKTMAVDGIIGGPTVKRHISMNFYVDTVDIPNTQSHAVIGNQLVGPVILHQKETTTAVRELMFGAVFDVNTAKSVVVWLNQKIKEIEEQNALLPKEL